MEPRKRLGEILIQMKLVTAEKIEDGLTHAQRTGTRLGEALVDLNMITEVDVAKALCRQNKLPFVDLTKVKLRPDVVDLIDSRHAEEYDIVPIKRQGKQIFVAIRDPNQVYHADQLQFVLNAEVKFALATASALTNAKAEYYGVGEKVAPPAVRPRPSPSRRKRTMTRRSSASCTRCSRRR